MRSVVGSSKLLEVLLVPPGGYNVPYLKSRLLQAKGYIRPIQKQLSLEPRIIMPFKSSYHLYAIQA